MKKKIVNFCRIIRASGEIVLINYVIKRFGTPTSWRLVKRKIINCRISLKINFIEIRARNERKTGVIFELILRVLEYYVAI